jgi:hypothetical protein
MDLPDIYAGFAYLLRSVLRFTCLQRRGMTKPC